MRWWVIAIGGFGCSYQLPVVNTGNVEDAPDIDAPPPACLANSAYAPGGPQAGHKYLVGTDNVDYDSAVEACARDGAHLAVVETTEENAFLGSLIVNGDAWIGFDDLDLEGAFRWKTGAPETFVGWNSGEPNDSGTEDCAVFRFDGIWNDASCAETHRAVCECDPAYAAPPVRPCRTMPSAVAFNFQGRQYPIQMTEVGWNEAVAQCQAMGAYLVVPSDDDENAAIEMRFPDTSWIGYSDTAAEGTFEWVNEAPKGYEHFESGEPSNGPNQNCVAVAFVNSRWDDTDCIIQRPFACECEPLRR